jgi:EF-hand domain pair
VKERERISVEDILAKVKRAAAKYNSINAYVSSMMRRYDTDNDGFISFQELSEGLDHDGIKLSREEKLALMKHLDADCDGVVSKDEIFQAMLIDSRHRRNHHHPKVNVDNLLKRVKQAAEKFKSLDEFVRNFFDKLDVAPNGALSFNKLS